MKNPLDLDATINGPVVELRYASHGEAMRQLRILREQLAQRAELIKALREIAWSNDSAWQADRARAAIAKATGETK
jgi:hypothetical protein